LSSATNAHAQIPSLTNYSTPVCYENFICKGAATCGEGDALDYPLGVLSLSTDTNAHISNATGTGSYPTKICCGGSTIFAARCTIASARWAGEGNAAIGEKAFLEVIGSSAQDCNRLTVNFKVYEDNQGAAKNMPISTLFEDNIATSYWIAEYVDDGTFGGDPEYYFEATIEGKTVAKRSNNLLTVSQIGGTVCGDGVAESGEACDPGNPGSGIGPDFRSNTCQKEKGVDYTGSLSCSSDCRTVDSSSCTQNPPGVCGDGVINSNDEMCDGNNFAGKTCTDPNKDEYTGGNLICTGDCNIDYSSCTPRGGTCGDGIREFGEVCDGNDLGTVSCFDKGPDYSGSVSCSSVCQPVYDGCIRNPPGVCGDGKINLGETCDPGNPGDNINPRFAKTCSNYDQFTKGTLSCLNNCNSIGTLGCSGNPTTTNSCDDYKTKTACELDSFDVGEDSNPEGIDCNKYYCGCRWNDANEVCGFSYAPKNNPGNPEDGCNYDATLCEGSSGLYCTFEDKCPAGENPPNNNNNKCEWGEGCLSADCKEGNIDTCANTLYCIDKKCSSVKNPLAFQLPGVNWLCDVTQVIEKECEEEPVGSRVISWRGVWTGPADSDEKTKCEAGGRVTVPCPAQVQLPFFDYFELFLSVLIIAVIYASIVLRKKLRHVKHGLKKRI
jgi:hypothetical protein